MHQKQVIQFVVMQRTTMHGSVLIVVVVCCSAGSLVRCVYNEHTKVHDSLITAAQDWEPALK